MQIEGSYSSSNPLIDRRLNGHLADMPLPTNRQQSGSDTTEATSRSIGEIVVSLRSELAMELPKQPGSDRRLVDNTETQQRLDGLNSAREAKAAQTAESQPSAMDQKSNIDSGGQVIYEVA